MQVIKPAFVIETPVDGDELLRSIERIGRTCYKSEDRITADSARAFVARLVGMGHESVLEHFSVTVRIVCDRGVTHEIVRHRIASYTQESTRYCNYTKGKFGSEITVIEPSFWDPSGEAYRVWHAAMQASEQAYRRLIELGASPQEARSVLPNSLKTEIVMTMNLRSWRNFFRLRIASGAHPQMREIALPLLVAFQARMPAVFDDIVVDGGQPA